MLGSILTVIFLVSAGIFGFLIGVYAYMKTDAKYKTSYEEMYNDYYKLYDLFYEIRGYYTELQKSYEELRNNYTQLQGELEYYHQSISEANELYKSITECIYDLKNFKESELNYLPFEYKTRENVDTLHMHSQVLDADINISITPVSKH